jgi:alpha-1,6-mannosyltransferase
MPLGSRDLWAYAAQGQLVRHGLDPYVLGPAALPGSFAIEVSSRWSGAAAPYGPLWLALGHLVAATISAAWLTVFVLRLFAVAGFALICWAVPILAERAGGRPDLAVWLCVANPLVLVLGVGGGHNDLLMVGLMMAGLAVATGPGTALRTLGWATIVITAAVAVKSPAVVALAFAVPLWLHHAPSAERFRGGRSIAVIALGVVAASAGVFVALTAATGLGWGWIHQVNSSAPIVNWMSIPTLLTISWNLVIGVRHGATTVNATMRGVRTAGTVLTVVLLTAGWLFALRRRWWELFAASLLVVVVLGPAVQPWYFCWPLAAAAVVVTSPRSVGWIAAASIGLVAVVRPNGTGLQMLPPVFPIAAGAALLAWFFLRRRHVATSPVAHR